MNDKPLDQSAIDALIQAAGKAGGAAGRSRRQAAGSSPPAPPPPEPPAADPSGEPAPDPSRPPVPVASGTAPPREQNYQLIADVPVEIAVVLGDLEMPIAEILRLKPGSVVQLDTWIDAPVEIRMRGRTVARAQIVTLEDSYALRIVENLIAAPDFPQQGR